MKLLFDIREHSAITGKYVTMRENCSYELDTDDLTELFDKALEWVRPHLTKRQVVFNFRLDDRDVPNHDSYLDEDRFTDHVNNEVACDPEYQGEEGLMQAYEDFVDNYEEIFWRGKILLVEL